MKICQTVFPQTSGYLKYRPKEGEGGGGWGVHLLEGWRLIEGGHLLISFSDSAAVEAQKKYR